MNLIIIKIKDVISRWMLEAMTGQLTFVIDFNQGGIRSVETVEKTRLDMKKK